MRTLEQIRDDIQGKGVFTGGPPHLFESAGRLQFYSLIREGLLPYSKVLDVGCGCLRAGYWLVRFLDPGCYHGIEPQVPMLEAGIEYSLTPELIAEKKPAFDTNDRFDFSVFNAKFDVVLARSIWSHAAKSQIEAMLDSFVAWTNPRAFFLTSYCPATWYRWGQGDYRGSKWVGRSHESSEPGLIYHRWKWLRAAGGSRGLDVRRLPDPPFNDQYWLKITRLQETGTSRNSA